MDMMQLGSLLLRWMHILAAITLVGGTLFMRLALVPSVGVLADEQRKSLHDQVRRRWNMLVMISIAFLLASGLINFLLFLNAYRSWGDAFSASDRKLYNMLFGIKVLLALGIFFLASALAGRSAAFAPIRRNATTWMTVNLVLAVLVVCISGVMRATHVGPNPPSSAPAVVRQR